MYLVQRRLRVELVFADPLKWLRRVWSLNNKELVAKCGFNGYFFICLFRAMVIIFVLAMCIIVPTLLLINFYESKNKNELKVRNQTMRFNVTGLDTISWQNVLFAKTCCYWGYLVYVLLIVT